jgi:hypothetical protein
MLVVLIMMMMIIIIIINIFHGRNKITSGAYCKYRTAATIYIQETWFVSGI